VAQHPLRAEHHKLEFPLLAARIRLVVWDQPELLFHFRLSHGNEVGIGYGDSVVTPEKMAELTVQKMRELARTTI
jgi:hypothetical protein